MWINLWKIICSEKNISFLYACFLKYWKRLLVKRLQKNFQFCIDYESKKCMVGILFLKELRRGHNNCCNLKLTPF